MLPAVPAPSEASSPIEEVRFLRDQTAAMAWAIESVVEGPAGRPMDRFEAWQRRLQQRGPASPPVPSVPPISYRLATSVADYWIRFVPVQVGSGTPGTLRLQLGALLDETGAPQPLAPMGSLLSGDPQLQLYDEEVPRAGVVVTRQYRFARWGDGSARLWISREKQQGLQRAPVRRNRRELSRNSSPPLLFQIAWSQQRTVRAAGEAAAVQWPRRRQPHGFLPAAGRAWVFHASPDNRCCGWWGPPSARRVRRQAAGSPPPPAPKPGQQLQAALLSVT